ncbi:uncharacterized protein PAC_02033 [Phialocephala subalpina]|uniref:BHLH domain-containing protein n=1 Tax=Phialocephala subalpina TaxID=576137 RepID=A0A1L7WH96_9HELO|nr:uncharacterized protein PAC_02033 [Phialocephala subalpina]
MPLRYLYLRGQEPSNDLVALKGPYVSECEITEQGLADGLDLDWDNWMKWDNGPGEEARESKTDILCSPATCFSDFEFTGKDEASPSLSATFEDAPFDLDEINDSLLFSPTSSISSLPDRGSQQSFDFGIGQLSTIDSDETSPAVQDPEGSAMQMKTIPDMNLGRPKLSRPLRIDTSARRGKRRRAIDEDDQEPTGESKKRGHNAIEKRYRTNLNEKINCLRDAIPLSCKTSSDAKTADEDSEEEDIDSKSGQRKFGKAAILTRALDYIKHLEQNTQRLGKEMDTLKTRIGAFERLARSGTAAMDECEMPKLSTPSTLESIQDEFKQMKTNPRSRSRSTPESALPRKRGRRPGKTC